jgi:uncharacterized phage-associated protein
VQKINTSYFFCCIIGSNILKQEHMAYKTLNLANSFIELGMQGEIHHLNSMKLQRLLFLTQAYSLQLYREAIIDESFIKWDYGPVIESLFEKLQEYRVNLLKNYIYEVKEGTENQLYYSTISKQDKLSWQIISHMANQYKEHKGSDLSNIIVQNPIWKNIENQSIINIEQMKSFYEPKRHLKVI